MLTYPACPLLQGMAGNIIHAIATTNAIVSGLIVIEAMKLLAGAPAACQTSFLTQQATASKRLVTRMQAPEPNSACMVCGTAQVTGSGAGWARMCTQCAGGSGPQRRSHHRVPTPPLHTHPQATLAIDTRKATLQQLVDKVGGGRGRMDSLCVAC